MCIRLIFFIDLRRLDAMAMERAHRRDKQNRCEWLRVFLSLAELVQSLAARGSRGGGSDDAPQRFGESLVLCDWKEDQFAVTDSFKVKSSPFLLDFYYLFDAFLYRLSKCRFKLKKGALS